MRLVTLKDNFPAGWTEKHRLLQVRVLDKLFQHQASHGGEKISDEIVNMVHSEGILASHPEYNFHSPSSPVVDAPPPSTSSTHKPDSTSPILGAEGWDSAAGEKPPHDADGTEECPVPTPTSQRADVTHEERGGTPPSTTPPTEEAPTRVDGGPRTEDKHVAQDPLPSPAGNDNPDANPLPPGASSACTDPRPPNCGTTPTAENDGVTDAPIEDLMSLKIRPGLLRLPLTTDPFCRFVHHFSHFWTICLVLLMMILTGVQRTAKKERRAEV